jgi:hypothetical protein
MSRAVNEQQIANDLHRLQQDWFVGDGVKTVFWLTQDPLYADAILVFVDGALKVAAQPGSTNDYEILGSQLTFVSAPVNLKVICVFYARI